MSQWVYNPKDPSDGNPNVVLADGGTKSNQAAGREFCGAAMSCRCPEAVRVGHAVGRARTPGRRGSEKPTFGLRI